MGPLTAGGRLGAGAVAEAGRDAGGGLRENRKINKGSLSVHSYDDVMCESAVYLAKYHWHKVFQQQLK